MKLQTLCYLIIGFLLMVTVAVGTALTTAYFITTLNTASQLRDFHEQQRMLEQMDMQRIEQYKQLVNETYMPILACTIYRSNQHWMGKFFVTKAPKEEMLRTFKRLKVADPAEFCSQHS